MCARSAAVNGNQRVKNPTTHIEATNYVNRSEKIQTAFLKLIKKVYIKTIRKVQKQYTYQTSKTDKRNEFISLSS